MGLSQTQFGEHITIDGYGGRQNLLESKELVLSLLLRLPEKLGMHILSAPLVVSAPDNELNDPGGWSGFVIIAESHISIHTFPDRGFVSADVYTCKNDLDVDYILNYFKETFLLIDIEHQLIKRGKKYPVANIY